MTSTVQITSEINSTGFVTETNSVKVFVKLREMYLLLITFLQNTKSRMFNEHGDTKMIGTFISVAIMLAVGGYLLAQFYETMPRVNASNPYAAMLETLANITNSAYGLLGIVLIVIAAVIIMWYVQRIS